MVVLEAVCHEDPDNVVDLFPAHPVKLQLQQEEVRDQFEHVGRLLCVHFRRSNDG